MIIKVTSEKQNPRAWGADSYTEEWEINEIAERAAFENSCLHLLERQVIGFYLMNKQMDRLEKERDSFEELRERLRRKGAEASTFQFTDGDYIYTFEITGGIGYVH